MRSTKRFVATAALATIAAGALAGPAAAHARQFEWVYSASTSDTEIRAQAELSTGKHPGTTRMTLKKRVDGEWKFVAKKVARYGDDGYYTATFSMVGGGEVKCKVWAKQTAKGHAPIQKASNSFDC